MEVKPVLTRTEGCGIQIHIGSLIGNELRRQRRPAAWLAQEICCDRTNVYKILRKSSIDTELYNPQNETCNEAKTKCVKIKTKRATI